MSQCGRGLLRLARNDSPFLERGAGRTRMADALGWRLKLGVVAPSTNTVVQPEFDAMRPAGVTNHFGRIHIPNEPLRDDDDFTRLIDRVRGELMAAVDR